VKVGRAVCVHHAANVAVDDLEEHVEPVTGGGTDVKAIAAAYTHTCALLTDGIEKCWGRRSLATARGYQHEQLR
jgi:hypothetical protein